MSEHPWLDGDLTVSAAVVAEIDAHAREAYPEESCGFVTGPAAEPARLTTALRATNVANKYHARDPERFPRTARSFYMIDARVIYQTFEAGQAGGQPVKVIYHSHVDVGAYFSAEDQAGAAPDGVASYPVMYLVTSVRQGGVVDDHKLFAYREGRWVEAALRIE
jgi:proteasome lid subunit RPN8/RPN11